MVPGDAAPFPRYGGGSGGDSQVVGVELGAGAGEDGLWAIYLFSGFLL